jgi:hypothetical protein
MVNIEKRWRLRSVHSTTRWHLLPCTGAFCAFLHLSTPHCTTTTRQHVCFVCCSEQTEVHSAHKGTVPTALLLTGPDPHATLENQTRHYGSHPPCDTHTHQRPQHQQQQQQQPNTYGRTLELPEREARTTKGTPTANLHYEGSRATPKLPGEE